MIKYKAGYKYQIVEDYIILTKLVGLDAKTDFIRLRPDGLLVIHKGYAWDGATGFPDIASVMRGSLVHDALYQLIRMELIPSDCKKKADRLLEDICIEDGMHHWMARIVYQAVEALGCAGLGNERKILTAP